MLGAMGSVPMPGGWALSTVWLPMCGQTWMETAAAFVGMWSEMMVPMMLAVAAPMLLRAGSPAAIAIEVAGYALPWSAFGALIFAVGAAASQLAWHSAAFSRAAPLLGALAVMVAGAFQLTGLKARLLDDCASRPARIWAQRSDLHVAWQHGLALGGRCIAACAGFTLALLAIGVTQPWAMAVTGGAAALERWLPNTRWVAASTGLLAMLAGACWMVRASWPG